MAMQMRFLQTLSDLGNEKNTTVVLPLPIDLLSAFIDKGAKPVDTLNEAEPKEREAA